MSPVGAGAAGGAVTLTNCESVSTVTVLKREERRRVAVTVPPDVSHPYSVNSRAVRRTVRGNRGGFRSVGTRTVEAYVAVARLDPYGVAVG